QGLKQFTHGPEIALTLSQNDIVAPDEVGASFERADEVIFEEEEDDGQTTRTRPEDPSPITSGVESGRNPHRCTDGVSSTRRRSWTPWLGSYHPSLHPGLHAATATRQYAYTLLPPLALDGWRPLPQRLRPCPAPTLVGSPMEMNEERKICKNKVEAEAWFTGLSALICRGQHGSQVQHIDGIRIAGLPFDHLVEPDHRRVVELNFRICLVYELVSKIRDAISYCAKAISLCKSRIQNLKSSKDALLAGIDGGDASAAEGGSEKSTVEKELEQLTSILPDLEKK
ncbi:hypothetical protein ACJX0J_033842, partial [Zea mays]